MGWSVSVLDSDSWSLGTLRLRSRSLGYMWVPDGSSVPTFKSGTVPDHGDSLERP